MTTSGALLEPNIAPYIIQASLSTNQKLRTDYFEFREVTKQIRLDDIFAALLMQAFAAFEWFIRGILLSSIKYIDENTKSYCDLSSNIAMKNIHFSGRALSIQNEAKEYNKIDIDQYCKNLGGCYSDSESFQLNSSAFGMFMKNINSDTLEEMLNRVGYKINWDRICRKNDIKELVNEKTARKAGNAVKEIINNMSSKRNEIAHQGDGSKVVGVSELRGYLNIIETVSINIAKDLEEYLKNYPLFATKNL
jgi:hypothetical protein